ncbi:MAG: hydroxymethylbilane synthase [Alphaproteobacteria bacterium]
MNRFKLATRGSLLALAQSDRVLERLQEKIPDFSAEKMIVKTEGDLDQSTPLHRFAGYGAFARGVNNAVLDGRADFAVHSLKDLPVEFEDNLYLAAIPMRDAVADVLVTRDGVSLKDLPADAVIGTSSLRRRAEVLYLNPSAQVKDIRGNIDTRIRKLMAGEFDAIILAQAGLDRLGIGVPFVPLGDEFIPAAGQGALAVVTRHDHGEMIRFLQEINDPITMANVTAERSFLRFIECGCHAPVGAQAFQEGNQMTLKAAILSVDGQQKIEKEIVGDKDNPMALARALAEQILDVGGKAILKESSI